MRAPEHPTTGRAQTGKGRTGQRWAGLPARLPAILTMLVLAGAQACLRGQAIGLQPPRYKPKALANNSSVTLGASPANLTIQLIAGAQATSMTPINLSVILVNPVLTTLDVYAFFASATSALAGSTSSASIPSSAVSGVMPGSLASSFTPFTQTNPFSGAPSGLHLLNLSGLSATVTINEALTLRIDLSSLPLLPADAYVGTLYFQAQVF